MSRKNADRCVWIAYLLGFVFLYAAMMGVGDLVERSRLRGWQRHSGTIVTGPLDFVAVEYQNNNLVMTSELPGWLGRGRDAGDVVETWVHPEDPRRVVVADTTPLHTLPVAAVVGTASAAALVLLLTLAARLRRGDRSARPAAATRVQPREWLIAAALPLLIGVGALGRLALRPETEGATEVGLAVITYLAAGYGIRRWMRAEQPSAG